MTDAGRASRAGVGLAISVVGSALLTASPARADLSSDVERLVRTWRDDGAEVMRLPPRFLEEGQIWTLPADHDDSSTSCTTLVVLTARSTEVDVTPLKSLDRIGLPSESPTPQGSDAGFAMVTRCGSRRAAWAHTVIEMSSRRGAVEALVMRSSKPARSPYEILPEREPVDRTPTGRPGRPATPAPIAGRLERAELRARSEGAVQVVRIPMRSSSAGTGRFELQLGEGCHRMELMAAAVEVGLGLPIDVDAEVRDVRSDRLLAMDRGDALDARMALCLGEKTSLQVSYVGAADETDVILTTSTWSIPDWVPSTWGPTARAGFAAALRRRGTPTPATGPLVRALGGQGWTRMPVTVEVGGCYLAAVAISRGQNDGLRLRATVDTRTSVEALPGAAVGLVVTFCSKSSEHAVVEVETRGQSPRWALAVWPLGTASP